MKCVILAGGFATRLWPITENRPKPTLPIGDKTIIEHLIDGIPQDLQIIISTNERFKDSFDEIISRQNRSIKLFVENSGSDSKKRGTLAAISDAIHFGGEDDYLILGGDNLFDFSIAEFIREAQKEPTPLIAAYDIESKTQARKFGVVEDKDGVIVSFEEKPKEPKSTLVSTLCYYLPRPLLQDVHEAAEELSDEAGKLFPFLMAREITCRSKRVTGTWSDIGSFSDYILSHKLLGKSSIPEKALPTNTFIGSNYVHPTVKITNSTIIDCIILEDCEISDSYLEGCIINNATRINKQTLVGQSLSKELNLT